MVEAAKAGPQAWVYIVLWITVSCSMILFNKAVLDHMKFPFPMCLCSWHMFLGTILTQFMAKTTNMLPAVKENRVDWPAFQKSILPVSIFYAFSLVLSNKSYIYLSVSYIQMLKAFTPVFTLIFSYLAGIEKSSLMEVYIVIVICIGVALASYGEILFSWTGFTLQSLAILFESTRLVLVGLLMKQLKLDPLSSFYYTAPCCFIMIFIPMLIFELPLLPLDRLIDPQFLMIMVCNGFVAFLLNIAVVYLIAYTSPLVLTLSGIVKDILLVALSVLILGSPVTLLQYIGYSLALLGLNVHKEYKKSPEVISALIMSFLTCGRGMKGSKQVGV